MNYKFNKFNIKLIINPFKEVKKESVIYIIVTWVSCTIKGRALLYLFLVFLISLKELYYSNIKSITWSLRFKI
jgi:hypothetical protein